MTETTADALAQVTELDEERRRYEGWLTQLEARSDSVPEHVLSRVRDDYRARLHDVVERLGGHAGMLRGAVEEMGRRVTELRSDEQRCADERAEGELRAAVGEYDAERWGEIESRTDATMADLVAERQQVEGELTRLQQVLELAAPSGTVKAPDEPAAEVAATAAEVATPPATDASAGAPYSGPTNGSAASGWGAPREDDIVDVESLAPRPAAEPEEDASSWSVGRGIAGGSGSSGPERESTHSPGHSAAGSHARRAVESHSTESSGTPQIKTLRCQECGTMNYPTEWYCERCGGELAAL